MKKGNKMKREYLLADQKENGIYECGKVYYSREKFLEYKGKKFLVWQMDELCKEGLSYRLSQYVVVPGCIVSWVYQTKHGKNAVECESVPEKERPELEKLIKKEGFKGFINFSQY